MQMIIDRFEEGYALLELSPQQVIRVPRADLPADAHEGDVLLLTDGVYRVDAAETANRKARMKAKLHTLFRKTL